MKQINFSDLENYVNSNSIVVSGVRLTEDDLPKTEECFHEIGLLPETLHIAGLCKIEDNVLGDEGRTDYLIELEGSGNVNIHVRRALCSLVHWTDDFLVNQARDYVSGLAYIQKYDAIKCSWLKEYLQSLIKAE